VHKLVQKCSIQTGESGNGNGNAAGSSCFNWRNLGSECGICFNALPEHVSFLAGPLDALLTQSTEKKARVVRQRAVAEAGEETKPEQVQNNSNSNKDGSKKEKEQVDPLSALLKQMKKKLRERCASEFKTNTERAKGDETAEKLVQETGMEVDGVQFLFNPHSFTQTVENIFHYSFLIKKGEAAIGVRTRRSSALEESSSGFAQHQGLHVKPAVQKEEENRQAVVAFTMKDWRALVQGYDLQQGDLPHRTTSSGKNSAGTAATATATAPSQSQ
jgi:hypothetical protein